METKFYSHGKLLLTAEYLILEGAKALAIPTQKGQSLGVTKVEKNKISWKSIDCYGKIWFEQTYEITTTRFIPKKELSTSKEKEVCQTLIKILSCLRELQPELLKKTGYSLTTELEFPQDWGLGSSSTLINNLATWANVNPYDLLAKTFGGSGYDLACAKHSKPILFQLQENENPLVKEVAFSPSFQDEIFFVHLNQKQNSREGIRHYRAQDLSQKKEWIEKTNEITTEILKADSISAFETLIETHENILANVLELPTVKQRLFKDYPRTLKSLGAWGGDFILATGGEVEKAYFKEKGYKTMITYSDMIL